jgi:GT2 family glycosyltransferase
MTLRPDDENLVTTVVVSRNRKPDVLETLRHHQLPVILVDNGSTDGTAEAVEQAYPAVQVVRLPRNQGATARNLGVALATTPYVAFADDDSWWAPGSIETAAEILGKHPETGLVAARILLGPENRLDPVCDLMANSPLSPGAGESAKPILGFVACAVVVRRDAFLRSPGYDPVIFFGGEEERLALDLAANGWALFYAPELLVHHHPSRTRGRPHERTRLILRNRLLTATMRRPWRVVVARTWQTLRSGTTGARALLAAVPRLPAALAERDPIPGDLERRVALLEAWQAGRS